MNTSNRERGHRHSKRVAARLGLATVSSMMMLTSISIAQPHRSRGLSSSSFEYKKSAAFNLKEDSIRNEGGITIRDVNYAAYTSERGRIKAYIVSPEGRGRFAGLLFFHWLGEPNGDRNEFLTEAVELAKQGTVSLLIQGYFPWDIQPDNGKADRRRVIDETIEVRRALDLLMLQPNVDRKRIGYVGHDYGAMFGSILAGIDKRVGTYVFVAGMGNFGDWSLKYWKGPAASGAESYRKIMSSVDPVSYLGRAAPASLLFQFSSADKYITKATATEYYESASRPKEIRWYETDHAMQLEVVRKDRGDWLTRQLRLSRKSK